jgi:ATP-binding cassette subfamily B protein
MSTNAPRKLTGLMKQYRVLIVSLFGLTIFSNALSLAIPKIIAYGIDSFTSGSFHQLSLIWIFISVMVVMFILTSLQIVVQTIASERVAKDLRTDLVATISKQDYMFVQNTTSAKLLTNITSDVDAVKMFVSMAIPSIVSSLFLIVGASTLLFMTNWRLALGVMVIIPIIGVTFYVVLSRIRNLFKIGQEALDFLNKVIQESIMAAPLIRLLNAQQAEAVKFMNAATEAKNISLNILKMFATLIPVITFATNLAVIIILGLGGRFVIFGTMSLGDFTAFNGYLSILVFPIIILGFTSNMIAMSSASYARITQVLDAENKKKDGSRKNAIQGDVSVKNVTVQYEGHTVLDDVSFDARAGKKTAIVGPTAAGKTQLLYVITGLLEPKAGVVEFDGVSANEYNQEALRRQIGFVFQDSILFNLSLRENIAFTERVSDVDLQKAIETSELADFIDTLEQGLDTVVSERGTSLSGGQKQRVMLARALAQNPTVLVLDDFTARVDIETERRIVQNVEKNYPNITLISVSQKIAPIEQYEHIVVLMEGELLAQGTHEYLMNTSPEYVQIYDSQQSINTYELQA